MEARYFKRYALFGDEIKAVNELGRSKIGKEVIRTYDNSDHYHGDDTFDDVMYYVTYETGLIFDEHCNPGHAGFTFSDRATIKKWVQKWAHLCKTDTYLNGWREGQWSS